jgi:hypothetical protein
VAKRLRAALAMVNRLRVPTCVHSRAAPRHKRGRGHADRVVSSVSATVASVATRQIANVRGLTIGDNRERRWR